ncbi:MAG: hypothetical protein A2157_17915 [Deltaproteobacteria bacterium RBG_16_47_11]|nr:MAG: hypothetical protein A2157_17915 [Deltaproteobacteria bacterium RBG_16_47_11]
MMKHFLKHLRTKIFAGILVVLPLGITFLVLKFVFNTLDSILDPLIPNINISLFHRVFHLPGVGIISFFLLLYLIGLITTNVLGRKLISWGDRLFTTIPVVKNIYTSSKQLTDAFSATRKGSFRQAVFVEFPQEGNFVLGFVTNELTDLERQTKVTVFVPTAFVPPQGFLLFLPKEKILPSQMTVEEAIKAIMSVGIVTPTNLCVSLSSPRFEKDSVENSAGLKYLNLKNEGGP